MLSYYKVIKPELRWLWPPESQVIFLRFFDFTTDFIYYTEIIWDNELLFIKN